MYLDETTPVMTHIEGLAALHYVKQQAKTMPIDNRWWRDIAAKIYAYFKSKH